MAISKVMIDDKLLKVLCYPKPSIQCLNKRLSELKELNIAYIILQGPIKLHKDISVLGKGYASIVVKAVDFEDNVVAVKIRRVDSRRPSLVEEAENLALANSVNVGPRLLGFTENVIVYEFIEGVKIDSYIVNSSDETVKNVLLSLLQQCFRLDMIGLDHGELSRPYSHILVTNKNKPYIIDFESSSALRRPSNVTSIIGSLIIKNGPLQEYIRGVLEINNLDKLVVLLRMYKKNPGPETFKSVLKFLNLTH